MAWSVKQQVGDDSPAESVYGGVRKYGSYIYTSGQAYDSATGVFYFVVQKRQVSDGTLTWQVGSVGAHDVHPDGTATDGTSVFTVGRSDTTGYGIMTGRLCTNGGLVWTHNSPGPAAGSCTEFNAADVDSNYLYVVGSSPWDGFMHVAAHNKGSGAQVWYDTGGSNNAAGIDVCVYDGYVYSCGRVDDGVGGYFPRVEKRAATNGALSWEVEDTVLGATHSAYSRLTVDSSGIYIISSADTGLGGSQDHFTLRKLALSDGATTWSEDVTAPGVGSLAGYPYDIIILGSKLYIAYSYETMFGTTYAIESRLMSTGAYVARDTYTAYTEAFYSIAGTSNAPAADEIIAVGSHIQEDHTNNYSYFYDFLASTGTSSHTQTMDGGGVAGGTPSWLQQRYIDFIGGGVGGGAGLKAIGFLNPVSDGGGIGGGPASGVIACGIVYAPTGGGVASGDSSPDLNYVGFIKRIKELCYEAGWTNATDVASAFVKQSDSAETWTKASRKSRRPSDY